MKDNIEDSKNAARKFMLKQAEEEKKAFIREVKKGLGKQMVEELEKQAPPTRRQKIWNKIKKVLNL